MLEEPSTLATLAFRIADTLKSEYSIDFVPTLESIGVDLSKRTRPGSRVVRSKLEAVWNEAERQTGDSAVGLVIGQHVEPRDYYVMGHAWLASVSLKDAFDRLIRYRQVLTSNVADIALTEDGDAYVIRAAYPDPERMPLEQGLDAGMAGLLRLCSLSTGRDVRPERAELIFPEDRHPDAYADLFRCPIRFGCAHNALWFSKKECDDALPGSLPEVASATDRIAREYIESFDRSHVATQVRTMLIQMLPAGKVDQEVVAKQLYRSASTLQRQLSAEGTTYRDVLAETRESLAKEYLSDPDYSPAEVAYMLGFADQSNFGRAFKRWTGMSPGEYQKAA